MGREIYAITWGKMGLHGMGIILLFTLRNIRANKLRTLLVICAVTLSAALFFGATGLSSTIAETYTDYLTKYYGSAEVMVYTDENSPGPFIPDGLADPFASEVDYSIGVLQA